MLKPTKILVPTDFSEFSARALQQALDIASDYKAKVYVLHVLDEKLQTTLTEDHADLVINIKDIKNLQKSIASKAKKNIHEQIVKTQNDNKVEVHEIVSEGVPYEEILRMEEELGIDLIVIGSLGKTGIARFLIGGVARNVLKAAKSPVLLTK